MRVYYLGYFDKFSRFFIDIEKELRKSNKTVHAKYFSIFCSGFLYSFLRFKPSSLVPFFAWFKALTSKKKYNSILSSSKIYKGLDLDKLVYYHKKLDNTINEEMLYHQAIAYIDIFHLSLIHI